MGDASDLICRALRFRRSLEGGTFLANIRKVIVEHLVPSAGVSDFISHFLDLAMAVMTPGGRERTEAEYSSLFTKAGLKLSRLVPTQSPLHVIEAVRA